MRILCCTTTYLYRWVRLSGQYCERLELSSAISVITIIRLLLARYYLLTVGSVSMQSSARQSDQVLISAHPIITIIIIITIGFFCHEAAPLKGIKLISIHLFLRLFVILKLNKVRTSSFIATFFLSIPVSPHYHRIFVYLYPNTIFFNCTTISNFNCFGVPRHPIRPLSCLFANLPPSAVQLFRQ